MMDICSEALVSGGLAEPGVEHEPSLLLHGDTGGYQSRRVPLVPCPVLKGAE
jgi:hypothetical protein